MPKMKAYSGFDAFHADQSPGNQAIIQALRDFVAKTQPDLREDVKWGNGCWINDSGPVAYTHVEDDHVQFGFFRGAQLDDPTGLLRGKGKYVRHIRLTDPTEIDESAFAALLRQAANP